MFFALHVLVMTSAFFNPSFSLSSYFETDGAPLSELSWPSSVAVVAVSFSGLFTFVFLMLACLCCKKGHIGFKEFDNTDGEGYQADLSGLNSPTSQNGPEVYILPLTEVSLPVSKQPSRSIQLLKSSDLGRHSLLYLKEIGHGWFGRVLLGEVSAGLSTTQVVVKELKASSSVQEQMQFLEENHPYQSLQHPAVLQCLLQCLEVTPYLLVMEFCPLGDLKTYLRSCQNADSETPDTLILQRMACDIASGLLHLHKHNFIHSDLALRNCLLTSDMSVKIGDYGLSHSRFKEDYYVTQDQIWVPLRWIAPELVDEVHGNLLVVDQTKSSNTWSLGVTLWELFELGSQPYRQYSDRQVLTYAVKEQQLKLPKPQLELPLSDRWYEVMQFCWLQPELRPSSEEVHLLVTYLCAKGSSEAEEDFEHRWNTLRPNLLYSPSHTAPSMSPVLTPALDASAADQTQAVEMASSVSSSFPLLEGFSDGFSSETGDDLLTVTETSQGLNFEYQWEQARSEQPYCSSSTSGPLGQGNPQYQDIYYTNQESSSQGCRTVSGLHQCHKPEHTGVVPVLSAHSPSVSSEYYIRIEEPVQCNMNLDDSDDDAHIRLGAINNRSSSEAPAKLQSSGYWSTSERDETNAYESDTSQSVTPTSQPLLKQPASTSPISSTLPHNLLSPSCDKTDSDENTPQNKPQNHTNCHVTTHDSHTNPHRRVVSSPSLGFCDPYLEGSTTHGSINEFYPDVICPVRKNLAVFTHIDVGLETEDGLLIGRRRSAREEDLLSEGEAANWISNHSANNNSLSFEGRQGSRCLEFQANTNDVWSLTKANTRPFYCSKPHSSVESRGGDSAGKTSLISSNGALAGIHKDERSIKTERHSNIGNSQSKTYFPVSIDTEGEHYLDQSVRNLWGVSIGQSEDDKNRRLEPTEALVSRTLEGRSSFLVELGEYSEEEDDMADITSGIFVDFNLDYADAEDDELTPTKNSETYPSSVGSASEQVGSPNLFSTPAFPKSMDSGYDTENNESPEFIFKELPDLLGGASSPILSRDPESVQQVGFNQFVCTSLSAAEMHAKGMVGKNPSRDSAYFSDYDAESERSPHEDGATFFLGPSEPRGPAERFSGGSTVEKQFSGESAAGLRHGDSCVLSLSKADPRLPHSLPDPGLYMLSPFPPQMGGCLTKESAPAEDDRGAETEHSGDEAASELSSCAGSQNSTVCTANHPEGGRTGEGDSTVPTQPPTCSINNCSNKLRKENNTGEGSTEKEELSVCSQVNEQTAETEECVRTNEEDFEDIDAEECDSLCEESTGPHELSTSSSLLELCGEDVRAPLEVAEDEDDTDDSESDEELRTYNVQEEESEGSEEDFSSVPVVVSDCSRARHLRGLLKMPTLLTESFCEELERKKKAVSFFDDVTVFLFDQESPTGELADFSLSTDTEVSEQELSESELDVLSCDALCSPKDLDPNNSEEGEDTEWDKDDHLESSPSLPDDIPESSTSSIPSSPDPPKAAAVALNRFIVSRFSITHVSDQHTESTAVGNGGDSPKD